MSARLISRDGKTRGEYSIDDEAVLGRSSRNAIVLKPELLSNRHARIWHDAERGCYMLEDLGSSNGTRLDGALVRRAEPLGHLHVITLAEHFDFIFLDEERTVDRHGGQGLAAEPVAQAVAERLGESSEVTVLENLPLPLPGFAASKDPLEESRERTRLDRLPLPLPGHLQQGRGEAAPEEEDAAGQTEGKGSDDRADSRTMHLSEPPASPVIPALNEKGEAPVSIPGPGQGGARATADLGDKPLTPDSQESAPEEAFGDTVFLEIVTPEGPVRHRLKEGENLIGRDPRADIRPASPEVSRRHALFRLEEGTLTVKDLASRNKTFVDGRAIREEVELKPGQGMKFGALKARVLAADGWEDER